MTPSLLFTIDAKPNPEFFSTGLESTLSITIGVGSQSVTRPYTGPLETRVVLRELRYYRGLSEGHFAYLRISGKRIEDDKIHKHLL